MAEFSLAMALFDAIPVLLFGGSMIMVAARFGHPVFIVGAALTTLAGVMKVTWKIVIGLTKKNVRWLDRPFVPMQITGFVLMLVSVLLSVKKIDWTGLVRSVTGFPSILLFILWIAVMGTMGWYRKAKFEKYSSRANWTAEILNTVGQGALFLAILFLK